MSAFGGHSRRLELERYLFIEPETWLMAFWDGQPAGMVGAVLYGPFAYIGLMGVHEDFQRRGIGRRLMCAIQDVIRHRGCDLILLDASEKGAPLYAQLGYRDESLAELYFLPGNATRAGIGAGIQPVTFADLPELASFDRPIFGADRRCVLEAYLRDFPGRAFLCRDPEGEITGYIYAQSWRLGPWAARKPEVADALLAAALSLEFSEEPSVIIPSRSPAAGLLSSRGFEQVRTLRHMYLGSAYPKRRMECLYGQASFMLG